MRVLSSGRISVCLRAKFGVDACLDGRRLPCTEPLRYATVEQTTVSNRIDSKVRYPLLDMRIVIATVLSSIYGIIVSLNFGNEVTSLSAPWIIVHQAEPLTEISHHITEV